MTSCWVLLWPWRRLRNCVPSATNAQEYRRDRGAVLRVRDGQSPEFEAFAWGFYVNSAIHRIVWGCERLMLDISELKTEPSWEKIKRECKDRQKKSPMASLENVLRQFYKRGPVSRENILYHLRKRVNRQKHQLSNEHPCEFQFDYVVHALELVTDLYWDSERRVVGSPREPAPPVELQKPARP
jgi:hypothetical protein